MLALAAYPARAQTVLANFTGTNGQYPYAGLTLSADGSTLYGTTYKGGAAGDGTVFSVPVAGGAVTTLATFNGGSGANPYGAVTLSADGGTLYGTTYGGGADGYGTVFSVPVSGGAVTTLATFPSSGNGSNPYTGDATYAPSTSNTFIETVTVASTTTGLMSSLNPSTYGQAVMFTATMSPSVTLDESVLFYDNGVLIGKGFIRSGFSTLTISTLPAGSDSITVTYPGDANYIGSMSSLLTQTVTGGP